MMSFLPPVSIFAPHHQIVLQLSKHRGATPQNCSPQSALTWEDWLQAAACSSREQARRRALGGNNLTPDPPLPQHELRTGFRKREERHGVNLWREIKQKGRGAKKKTQEGRMLKHKVGGCHLSPLFFHVRENMLFLLQLM